MAPPTHPRLRRATAFAAGVAACLCAAALGAAALWARLENDGVHDPRSPALPLLQQPADALSQLPRDTAGNMVNWVKAIDSGAIDPRSTLWTQTPVPVRDDEFIIAKYGSLPAVKFPHRQHTLWLACENCHEALFKSKAGANQFSMTAILNGEQCGVCHGAVAFPLTECNRCHSVPNSQVRQFLQEQQSRRSAQQPPAAQQAPAAQPQPAAPQPRAAPRAAP
jgi:c(7)-type cytochrome triheme protein